MRGELAVLGGFALVFVAVALGLPVVVLRVRKRARIAWSILLESSAACSSCLRAAPPRRLVPFSAQLSASRSWLQCLPPFSRPGPTKHIGQVLTPCTKSGSCVLVAAWAGLCRFRGGLPSSSWGELCIRGVPATVTSVPSILSPSQRGGRAASLGGRSWPGAGRSASGLLPDPYSWATLGSSPGVPVDSRSPTKVSTPTGQFQGGTSAKPFLKSLCKPNVAAGGLKPTRSPGDSRGERLEPLSLSLYQAWQNLSSKAFPRALPAEAWLCRNIDTPSVN